MKILVVTNMYPDKKHPNYGVFVKKFCEQLSDIDINYDLIKINKTTSKFNKMINYFLFFIKSFFVPIFKSYDYVYIHYVAISGLAVVIARKFKKFKIIANAHGSDIVPENTVQEKKMKNTEKCLLIADKIVVPSDYFKDVITTSYEGKIDVSKIYVYPSGGIDKNTFYKMSVDKIKDACKTYQLNSQKKYYGYCGRIDKNKGIDTLIEAISDKRIIDSDIDFIIVGSGLYNDEMKKLIDKKGLQDRIHCFGMMTQEQLNDFYNIFQCFIFPTERKGESLGLVAIEAMACSTPVIASDFSAPKYYIKDNYNGYKFEVSNIHDLADKIYKLLCLDQDDYKKLCDGAYHTSVCYRRENISGILKQVF